MSIQNGRSDIGFGDVTRGDERVFIQVFAPAEILPCTWVARSWVDDGRAIPAKVVVLETGEPVLVLPVFAIDSTVALEARDGQTGELLASGTRRVSQQDCKHRSRLNTLLKGSDVARIRNCDRIWRANETRITDLRLIGAGDADILRFNVTRKVDGRVAPTYLVSVFDDEGFSIAEPENAIVMGEATYDHPDCPGIAHNRTAFAVRIPVGLARFCLWVQVKGAPEGSTFDCVWHDRIKRMRTDWQRLSCPAEFDDRYHEWFCAHRATPLELRLQRRAQGNFALRPKFSLVVPLYRTPVALFDEMASSALAQTYDNLELVLVNSTPDDRALAEAVANTAARDGRVRVIELEGNRGISGNTYAGIAAATGDFVCFFDHDDVIEQDLLYRYVQGINTFPETDLLYCDEDKLEAGRYTFPFFKPDWDPFFLETNNYLCHLMTVRRTLLDRLPKPGPEFDGAQDHFIALAAGEQARNVFHARRVLYHWRMHEGSTAGRTDVKTESIDAGRMAVERHFERLGLAAQVVESRELAHCYCPVVTSQCRPAVSVLVCGADPEEVHRAAAWVRGFTAWESLEVVEVACSCASGDLPSAVNAAALSVQGDYLVLLDMRSRPRDPSWVEGLLAYALREGVGAVVPKVTLPDGSVKTLGLLCSKLLCTVETYRDYPPEGIDARGYAALAHQITSAREYCLMVSRTAFEAAGGVPADCAGMFWAAALCLGIGDAGWAVLLDPAVKVSSPVDDIDLTENAQEAEMARRSGEYELMARFPARFDRNDHFYNRQLRQDGYYGVE